MSTSTAFKDAPLLPSDDEDGDFQLSDADAHSSGRSDSDDSDDDDGAGRKRKRTKVDALPQEEKKPVLSKNELDDLWASFNDDTAAPASASTSTSASLLPPPLPAPQARKIQIQTSYKFAAETIVREKWVLEDSDEALRFFAEQPGAERIYEGQGNGKGKGKGKEIVNSTTPLPAKSVVAAGASGTPSAEDLLFSSVPSSSSTTSAAAAPPPPVSSTSLPPKLAPPKRPRGGGLSTLAALASGKPAKLNTLEKSKLDWQSFVDKSDLEEDLKKARKDGYLEKVDFLNRTEEVRERELERVKGSAKRSGK